MSFAARLLSILVVALGLFLIGNRSVSLWDRDEPRYAECSREMLQTGDWVVPRFLGQWRIEKPPFIYWCQAAAMTFLGDTPFAARLPSTLAIVLTGLLLGMTVRHFTGPSRALWTVVIFSTTALAIAAAKMCITDAVLLLFVAAGQVCLAILWNCSRIRAKPPVWTAPLFWISTGLAGLTKGPQALGMHAMTILILLLLEVGGRWRSKSAWIDSLRWLRLTRPLAGIPLLALVVAPWLILIQHRAPGFLQAQLFRASRYATTGMEGHGWPFGFHTLLLAGTFFPWSLLLPTTLTLAWRHRRLPAIRFALAAALGPWLLMEMVTTKLPFYILPAFPALAFLTADALLRCVRRQHDDLTRKAFFVLLAVWSVAVLVLGAAPWLSLLITRDIPMLMMVALVLLAIIDVAVVKLEFSRRRFRAAAAAMAAGMALSIAVLYAGVVPQLPFLSVSKHLGEALRRNNAYGRAVPLAMIGYQEPSLAFYQGGGARERDDRYLLAVPPGQWPQWIVITQNLWQLMPPQIHKKLRVVDSGQGIRYSIKGRLETVLLLKKSPPSAAGKPLW